MAINFSDGTDGIIDQLLILLDVDRTLPLIVAIELLQEARDLVGVLFEFVDDSVPVFAVVFAPSQGGFHRHAAGGRHNGLDRAVHVDDARVWKRLVQRLNALAVPNTLEQVFFLCHICNKKQYVRKLHARGSTPPTCEGGARPVGCDAT